MATEDREETEATGETTVSDSFAATVPAEVRDRLDLRPGDKLRWRVVGDELRVEVVHQREGVFDDFEALPGEVDVVAEHDHAGAK